VLRTRARSTDGGERGARDGSGGRRLGQAGHAAAWFGAGDGASARPFAQKEEGERVRKARTWS